MSGSTTIRRTAGAPPASYASIVAGQTRVSATDHHYLSENRSNPNAQFSGSGSFPSQPVPLPMQLPAYLKHSSYAERLHQINKAPQAKQPIALPTPPSSLTVPGRLPQVHRATAFDVAETTPVDEDGPSPLPSRWNENDKSSGIDVLKDGTQAKFIGPVKHSDHDAAAVRADHPMPPQCGVFYYEIKIMSKAKESLISIGFCTSKVALNRLPGWEQDSWGYHGDDGHCFACTGQGKNYGPQFGSGDVVGCGINFRTNSAFFTKNGHNLGVAFRDIRGNKLYPAVGMKKHGEHVEVNFGQQEFVFDIASYMKEEKVSIHEEIKASPVVGLQPPLDESSLIQALVSSYLAHDGYVDTARTFAEDVQKEARALATSGRRGSIRSLDIKEDKDAINRQRIRAAVLDGDVDRALKLTEAYYPKVFKENEMTYFRLKCRKLVEMIALSSGSSLGLSRYSNVSQKAVGDIFCPDMEIDDHSHTGAEWVDRMEVEEDEESVSAKGADAAALDAATVKYAQQLRIEFESDKRPEIRKALEEAFSLVAYQDPRNSVQAHLFDEDERIAVAEELNSAILVSLGKSSVAPLERLVQQSTALIQELSEDGGPGAFVNVHEDYLEACSFF